MQCRRSSPCGWSSAFPAHGTMGRAWGRPGRNTNPAHFRGQTGHGRERAGSRERALCGGRPAGGGCALPNAGSGSVRSWRRPRFAAAFLQEGWVGQVSPPVPGRGVRPKGEWQVASSSWPWWGWFERFLGKVRAAHGRNGVNAFPLPQCAGLILTPAPLSRHSLTHGMRRELGQDHSTPCITEP